MYLSKIGIAAIIAMIAFVSMASAVVEVSIDSATVDPDGTTTVNIIAHDATTLGEFGIMLDYDTSVVNVTDVQNNPEIPDTFGISDTADDGSLSLVSSGMTTPSLTGAEVQLVTITLKAVGSAGDNCALDITVVSLKQTDGTVIEASDTDGTFTITGEAPPPSGTYVSIDSATVDPDGTTTVNIIAHDATTLGEFGIMLDYDTSVVNVTDVQNNPEIPDTFGISDTADDGSLSLVSSGMTTPSLTGAEVQLVTITLKAVGSAGDNCALDITVVSLKQTDGTTIDASDVDGTFTIREAITPALTTFTVTPPTVEQGDTVEIDIAFSTEVSWVINVDSSTATVKTWSGTSTNPAKKYWVTTTGTPTGEYTVDVFMNGALAGSETVTVTVEAGAVSVTLYEGWNLIAVPVNDPTADTAAELALKITGCKEVVMWNAAEDEYVTYTKIGDDWTGTDFTITGGMGIFVNMEGATTVGFTGDAWS